MPLYEDQIERSEKYSKAVDLLDSAIMVICDAYNLKPVGPPHDIASIMLYNFFDEVKEEVSL